MERRDGHRFISGSDPTAQHVAPGVRQGAEDRDRSVSRQRQQLPVVFQQYDRLARGLASELPVFRARMDAARLVAATEGLIEKPEIPLGPQNPQHRRVDLCHIDRTGPHQVRQLGEEGFRDHVHVHPGIEGLLRGVRVSRGGAMIFHFGNGGEVGDDPAGESPLATQQVGEQPAITAGRDAVDLVEGRHHRPRAGLDRRAVGREVGFLHLPAAHVHGIVIATAHRRAVEREMLHAGDHAVFLIAAHHGRGDLRGEPRILTRALGDPAPAGVQGNIDHRREHPVEAIRRRFERRHTGAALDEIDIP